MGKIPFKQYGRYGSVGIELILSMILGYLGGRWLDGRLGTHWITWLGAAVGVYAGFRTLFVTARKMQRDIEQEEREERTHERGEHRRDP
jgi:hypothetical protein